MEVKLKNGSGIHIKKKNRGKFTEYCGGKVTDACIRKAKSSGNPTLVKRATFAANARKWKHRNGGLLFAQEGNKINWADISGAAVQGLMNIYGAQQQKKAVDKQIEADKLNDKANQAKLLSQYYQEELNKLQNETLPDGIHSSSAFNSYLAHQRAQRRVQSEFQNNTNYAEQQAAAQNNFTDSIIGAFGGVMNAGFGLLANKNKNNPPSSQQA